MPGKETQCHCCEFPCKDHCKCIIRQSAAAVQATCLSMLAPLCLPSRALSQVAKHLLWSLDSLALAAPPGLP